MLLFFLRPSSEMLRPDVAILQPSVLDSSIASNIKVGKKTWRDWPEKVSSLYLGNIKREGGLRWKKKKWFKNEPKRLIFDVSWRSKVKKGPNEWKNVDQVIPKTQQVFEQEPSDS